MPVCVCVGVLLPAVEHMMVQTQGEAAGACVCVFICVCVCVCVLFAMLLSRFAICCMFMWLSGACWGNVFAFVSENMVDAPLDHCSRIAALMVSSDSESSADNAGRPDFPFMAKASISESELEADEFDVFVINDTTCHEYLFSQRWLEPEFISSGSSSHELPEAKDALGMPSSDGIRGQLGEAWGLSESDDEAPGLLSSSSSSSSAGSSGSSTMSSEGGQAQRQIQVFKFQ